MYNSEELFINKFIASLKRLNVSQFPFDNEAFYSGIQKMQDYYHLNRSSMGEADDELSMLFIKRPFDGLFSEFKRAISKQNGWYLSFLNPDYLVADIKISHSDADYTLKQSGFSVSNDHMMAYAKAFCEGAQITV